MGILTAEERASSLAAGAALAYPVLSKRLASLARPIHETVRPPAFYAALSSALEESWNAPFFAKCAAIDDDWLSKFDRVRSLDPMFYDAIAKVRMHLHMAEALDALLRFMRHTRHGMVYIVFKDALKRWRPRNFGRQLESLLIWLPPPAPAVGRRRQA